MKKRHALRTTIVGGILFLVPFGVLLVVAGKVFAVMHRLAQPLSQWIPVDTIGGITVADLLAVALLLLVCYLAGFLATSGRMTRVQRSLDERLLLIFPRYNFLKGMLEGFDRERVEQSLRPVIVEFDDLAQICFEVERREGRVTVFIPGSPDPWSGSVALVTPERVRPLDAPFPQVVKTLRSGGAGTGALFAD